MTALYKHSSSTPVVYFPIVWSNYNPASVELVEKFYQQNDTNFTLSPFSIHRGTWRPYGKGMYVMMGSDAKLLQMDTSFKGWGGEDKAFFNEVNARRRIFRCRETGLVHAWHHKDCNSTNFVSTETNDVAKQLRDCHVTNKRQDGSEFGQYLLDVQNKKTLLLAGKKPLTP